MQRQTKLHSLVLLPHRLAIIRHCHSSSKICLSGCRSKFACYFCQNEISIRAITLQGFRCTMMLHCFGFWVSSTFLLCVIIWGSQITRANSVVLFAECSAYGKLFCFHL